MLPWQATSSTGRVKDSNTAAASRRVLVVYGFGFTLEQPAQLRLAFASPQAFAEHFSVAAASGMLMAAFAEWDAVRPQKRTCHQQGRKRRNR